MTPEKTRVAAEIAAKVAELAREAKAADLPMLAYLLDCVRLEANQHIQTEPPPESRDQRI